jgi:hypothetical protein
MIYPTGAGTARELSLPGYRQLVAVFTGKGDELVLSARKDDGPVAVFLYDPDRDTVQQISPEGVSYSIEHVNTARRVAVIDGRGEPPALLPLDGGDPQPIPGMSQGEDERVVGMSLDGGTLYVSGRRDEVPRQVFRQDLRTGAREPFLELMPASRAGLISIGPIFVTPDGSAYLYSYRRYLSTLYMGEDL